MMSPGPTVDVVLKRFEAPDEVRNFTRGRFELVTIAGTTIGRATYQPGWKWSVDVGPTVGATRCRRRAFGTRVAGEGSSGLRRWQNLGAQSRLTVLYPRRTT